MFFLLEVDTAPEPPEAIYYSPIVEAGFAFAPDSLRLLAIDAALVVCFNFRAMSLQVVSLML